MSKAVKLREPSFEDEVIAYIACRRGKPPETGQEHTVEPPFDKVKTLAENLLAVPVGEITAKEKD